jgi:hypothetical protein
MDRTVSNPRPRGDFRMTLTGDGRPGPIEERIGRRLVRLVEPESEEGLSLLAARCVRFIGPGGTPLGYVHPSEAIEYLREALEERLEQAEGGGSDDCPAFREGLDRLENWSRKIGRA